MPTKPSLLLFACLVGCESPVKEDDSGFGGRVGVHDDGGETGAMTGSAGGDDGAMSTDGSGSEPSTGAEDLDVEGGEGVDTGDAGRPSLEGFIGSPCTVDSDCDYSGGVCLTDGFLDGMCSAVCERTCPDEIGFPVTFCVDASILPDESLSGGWCVSRCAFGYYPESGCREEFGCRVESRYEESETQTYACVPGESSDLSDCHLELAARGVGFEPTVRRTEYPDGRPDKECEIADPVWVETPLQGVALRYVDSEAPARVLAGCEMAHALADTVEDVAPYGVTTLLHIGTYNCRMIGGSDSLSEHSFANAIDIYGFEFSDGEEWTLIDHWEHDTDDPVSEAATFLYDASRRWYDEWIWNIILTPNYNLAHDNHFHVDLKDGWHDLSIATERYYGPALYRD